MQRASLSTEIQRTVSKSYLEYTLADLLAWMSDENGLIILYKYPRNSGMTSKLREHILTSSQHKKSRAVKDFIRAVKPLFGEFFRCWPDHIDEIRDSNGTHKVWYLQKASFATFNVEGVSANANWRLNSEVEER
jgi:hypothetical protein